MRVCVVGRERYSDIFTVCLRTIVVFLSKISAFSDLLELRA